MSSALRVAVTGLAATYPYGGVFWDYLQYPLGLRQLGHDVLYIEDTGKWCYDPVAATFVASGHRNAGVLGRRIDTLMPELTDRWYVRDADGATYGRSAEQVTDFCRSADLFLHLSASCWMREDYFAAARVAFVDSDPMYTQDSVPGYVGGTLDDAARARVDLLRRHDVFFTFGENIGTPGCRIPTQLFDWRPTRQPVVLDRFEPAIVPPGRRRQALTTVGSWEPAEAGPVVDGVAYGGKGREFERFLGLPSRLRVPVRAALSGRVPTARLLAAGWLLDDPVAVSADPADYRRYLATSLAEFSVAKHAYVASRSGWFSCRSACYLALGVPVVVQDTGYGHAIPTGAGVLAFSTLDEAAAACDAVVADPEMHATAAHDLARTCFDARTVLTELLERAFASRIS